jgi:pyruvate kinase
MKIESDPALPKSENWNVPSVMATVGPTLEKAEDLQLAIKAGAGWLRLPCGYRQRPHIQNSRAIRLAAEQVGIPVQLLLDLPSSRPRTGNMQELRLAVGDRVIFWDPEISAEAPTEQQYSPVPLPGLLELLREIQLRHRMWFCDGRLNFIVESIRESSLIARMENGAISLKSSNSIFLPDSPSPFAVMTSPDRELLSSMAQAGVFPDWVALSLIGSPEDVAAGRKAARELLGRDVRIMAKFETIAAVEAAREIIREADGIMVARGDLGLAIGYVRLPEVQEQLVKAARRAGKVTVVATQVLEMFAQTGIPQRAELSDLSLIARQRADAVMLGKETVFSPRPIECIRLAREVMAYETRRFEKSARPSKRTRAQALMVDK